MTTICAIDAFEDLRDEWNAVSAPMASPLLDHEWFASGARAFHADGSLQVVVVRQGGSLAAAAPLAFADVAGRRLALIGGAPLYEPGDWIHLSEEALASLARAVVRIGAAVAVPRIPRLSALWRAVPAATRRRAVAVVRPSTPSLGVDIATDWETYCLTLSARTRQRLEAARDRAARQVGPVTLAMLTPRPEDVEGLLDTVLRVEASGWKGRAGSALALRPAMRAFFHDYGRRLAERRQLRVSTLSIGQTVAAVEVAVQAHGRRWGLKVAYHEGAAGYAPALQLVHASIREAFDAGLRSYEFLGVAEPWQERWRPARREYAAMALYPMRPRGVLCAVADAYSVVARRFTRSRAVAAGGESRLSA